MIYAKVQMVPLTSRLRWVNVWHSTLDASWSVGALVLILGGIYGGVFSPTDDNKNPETVKGKPCPKHRLLDIDELPGLFPVGAGTEMAAEIEAGPVVCDWHVGRSLGRHLAWKIRSERRGGG